RSGFLQSGQMLDESAHVYKAILLDEQSRPITRHQIWLTSIKGYDNAIQAGRSDIARFRFRVPRDWNAQGDSAVTLRAVVNYRRFNQEYTNYVLSRQGKSFEIPVVRMAEADVTISSNRENEKNAKGSTTAATDVEQQARRWNDYGIALLEQAQYG